MIARAEHVDWGDTPREDHYVHLYGVTWADYLRLLEIRGERSVPRLTYVEGTLEIMSPSRPHDQIKSYVGRLVEAWCLERDIEFTPYGSWTLTKLYLASISSSFSAFSTGRRRAKLFAIIEPRCAARSQGAARDSVRGWPAESIVSSLIGLRHTLCR